MQIWHVVTMDNYVAGPYTGRGGLKAAVAEARTRTLDPRKKLSGLTRYDDGSYEHTRYRGFDGDRWSCYWIIPDDRLAAWPAAHEEHETQKKEAQEAARHCDQP